MKAVNVRGMTPDQLDDELEALKKEQFNLRFQKATGQLEKTARVREVRRDIARIKTIARQKAAVDRTLNALERDLPQDFPDIGSITVACALGYLDFRYAAEPWREGRPRLTAWYEAFAENPGIARTVPHE